MNNCFCYPNSLTNSSSQHVFAEVLETYPTLTIFNNTEKDAVIITPYSRPGRRNRHILEPGNTIVLAHELDFLLDSGITIQIHNKNCTVTGFGLKLDSYYKVTDLLEAATCHPLEKLPWKYVGEEIIWR